ncbi:PREDICTED: uncharacterized protein LOC106340975 [Brassica oleracea var. oleracea]|uniref:uncharacterized protein LOC106340975 n=1 Tax=Brassica oleracea var. oleracea TaxID=109376 RepID=UPI0006A73519|nr:PREDICTED: uncharacterized protein LOC106340975 [Brassica oleracea var. oleracea]
MNLQSHSSLHRNHPWIVQNTQWVVLIDSVDGQAGHDHITPLAFLVHAQQYQKQQENSTAILTRSCKFGMTIRKEARSLSTDDNPSVSLDSAQPPSTQTPVPSTDYRSPWSTENTNLLSTDILHPTDIPSQTSIDTEPRDMVAPLILVRDNNGDLHDQEGHLRNAAGQRIYAQGAAIPEPDATTTGTTLPVDEAAQPKTLAD